MIDNSLTPASFDSLLAYLGPDRESAARAYLGLPLPLLTLRGFFASGNSIAQEEIHADFQVRTDCP